MNDPLLKPWIAAEKTGTVWTGQWTGMAGLGVMFDVWSEDVRGHTC